MSETQARQTASEKALAAQRDKIAERVCDLIAERHSLPKGFQISVRQENAEKPGDAKHAFVVMFAPSDAQMDT